MSKVIQVNGKWAGTVTIADPLTIPQVQLIEAAFVEHDGTLYTSTLDAEKLPAIFACVIEWKLNGLEGVTLENFPATPRKESHRLVDAIFSELIKIYVGEVEVPNA